MTTGADVVDQARTWLGTRWRHQGCAKGVACDCIGLVGGVASELDLSHAWVNHESAAFKGYGRQPHSDTLLAACDQFLIRVRGDERRLGDILVMRVPRGTDPQHFAILSSVNPPMVIHSYAQARRVVENRLDDEWAARVVRVYRLPGLIG